MIMLFVRLNSGTAYGSLVRGRSVCAGYAEAFQLVALKAGLQVRYVRNGNHAWNLVKVGGKWYHIDACWDGTGGDKRRYFLKGSESMSEVADHAIEDCYPSKVTVAKKDYVERMPPVEVIDDGDADDAADAGNGDRAPEAATRETPTPSLGAGYANAASTSAGLKDPSADPPQPATRYPPGASEELTDKPDYGTVCVSFARGRSMRADHPFGMALMRGRAIMNAVRGFRLLPHVGVRMSSSDRDIVHFAVWLLGKLAGAWGVPPREAYRILQEENLVDDYIVRFYDPLHTMGELALVEDVTLLARKRGLAV